MSRLFLCVCFYTVYITNSLLHKLFCHFADAGTCSSCRRTQYDTPNPKCIFEFQIISSFNIRKKTPPLQLLKSSRLQSNAVEYTLCNQCHRLLSKETKSNDFADRYPSFLWNLLVGKHVPALGPSYYYRDIYSGEELWRMIPSTMRPWWISVLIDPNQDWFHSYGQQISLKKRMRKVLQ